MARKAAKQLMQRTKSRPDDIDLVIVATTTSDYRFSFNGIYLVRKAGAEECFRFDMQAVCSVSCMRWKRGANLSVRGNIKKIIIVGADKMSSVIDYTDRATCPIFGDGAAAFMLEPTTEEVGIMDSVLRTMVKGCLFCI